VVDLVDRHGRHVAQWQGRVQVTAFIDASIFPPELFAAGTPSPSPTNRPVLGTHFVEPSVLQKQLYPDNVLVQLVAQPLALQGATTVTLSLDTGVAVFPDLRVTRVVRATDGVELTRATSRWAHVDLATRKPTPIADSVRSKLMA
jgi:hypothetical protein